MSTRWRWDSKILLSLIIGGIKWTGKMRSKGWSIFKRKRLRCRYRVMTLFKLNSKQKRKIKNWLKVSNMRLKNYLKIGRMIFRASLKTINKLSPRSTTSIKKPMTRKLISIWKTERSEIRSPKNWKSRQNGWLMRTPPN